MTKKFAVDVLSANSEGPQETQENNKEVQCRKARQHVNNLGKKKRFMLKRCRDFMQKYDQQVFMCLYNRRLDRMTVYQSGDDFGLE